MERIETDLHDGFSDTACLEVLSHAAAQFGMDWANTVRGREAEALTIARELQRNLQRLLDCGAGRDEEESNEPVKLTALELDVLKWAAMGKGAAVTAQIMGISERAVRKARETIGRKLGSNSVLLSVAIATRLGLL